MFFEPLFCLGDRLGGVRVRIIQVDNAQPNVPGVFDLPRFGHTLCTLDGLIEDLTRVRREFPVDFVDPLINFEPEVQIDVRFREQGLE